MKLIPVSSMNEVLDLVLEKSKNKTKDAEKSTLKTSKKKTAVKEKAAKKQKK